MMPTHLLDTNTCIAYLNGKAISVARRLQAMPPANVVLCAIVKAELLYGAMRGKDPARELAKLLPFFTAFGSLPFDDRCADIYGRIRAHLAAAGMVIGPHDLLIAAIALAHDLTLVTHNTREFSRVPGLRLEDWQAPTP